MQYITHDTQQIYSGDRATWRDIPATSERPGVAYRPVLVPITEPPGFEHTGWEYDASLEPPAEPNWPAFNAAMMADDAFNAAVGLYLQAKPIAAIGIPTAFAQIVQGNLTDFQQCYAGLLMVAEPTEANRNVWRGYAATNNLPQEFIDLL
jgi:hypothetical protein